MFIIVLLQLMSFDCPVYRSIEQTIQIIQFIDNWHRVAFVHGTLKAVTFGIKNCSTKSSQLQPKLIIDGSPIPFVKNGENFRYLGYHFDFNMSNNTHKFGLSELINSMLTDIDLLPLHPKNKIALFYYFFFLSYKNKFLKRKIKIHFLVNTRSEERHGVTESSLQVPLTISFFIYKVQSRYSC